MHESEAAAPRLTGEAAWKAALSTTEQRNAAAKRRAHEHNSTTQVAALRREHRLALAETEQLEALNRRIATRAEEAARRA